MNLIDVINSLQIFGLPQKSNETYSCVTASRKPQNYVHLRFSCTSAHNKFLLANNIAKERLLTIGSFNVIPIIFVTKTDLFRVLRLSYCVSGYAREYPLSTGLTYTPPPFKAETFFRFFRFLSYLHFSSQLRGQRSTIQVPLDFVHSSLAAKAGQSSCLSYTITKLRTWRNRCNGRITDSVIL